MSGSISDNLTFQSQNFGQEAVITNTGTTQFTNPATGKSVQTGLNATSYVLNNGPVDNSFQLNPNQYNVATSMFSGPGVPQTLSNTFGAVAAATAKSLNISPVDLYQNGVLNPTLITNLNYFRDASSQIGYNTGSPIAPYYNNLMLGAKIFNQVN